MVTSIDLRANNLYINGLLLIFEQDGEQSLIRTPLEIIGQPDDLYYRVIDSDRLDLLAYKFYGKIVEDASKYWWVIADANKIFNPLDISEFVGKEILIPNINRILLQL